jgi:hypothetical protein
VIRRGVTPLVFGREFGGIKNPNSQFNLDDGSSECLDFLSIALWGFLGLERKDTKDILG